MRITALLLITLTTITLSGCIDAFFEGTEFTKDKSEILIWKEIAGKGDIEAQYKVGKLYCCGERPYKNTTEALRWFCKAAKNEQADAQFEVGKLYSNAYRLQGSNIPNDHAVAYTYFKLAEENNHSEAYHSRKSLEKTLSDEDRAKSEEYLKEWPYIPCRVSRKPPKTRINRK